MPDLRVFNPRPCENGRSWWPLNWACRKLAQERPYSMATNITSLRTELWDYGGIRQSVGADGPSGSSSQSFVAVHAAAEAAQ
jgi:hypothetical protein